MDASGGRSQLPLDMVLETSLDAESGSASAIAGVLASAAARKDGSSLASRSGVRIELSLAETSAFPAIEQEVEEMVTGSLSCGGVDVLLSLAQSGLGKTALLHVQPHVGGSWTAAGTVRNTPVTSADWAFDDSVDDQRQALDANYDALVRWLGQDHTLVSASEDRPNGKLVVRLDAESRWFLKFPLSAFQQLGIGFLARFRGVEWLVSGKTYVEHYRQRAALRAELSDLERFLSGSVIFLNFYAGFAAFEECVRATAAVIPLLRLLSSLRIGDGTRRLNLRWFCNPSAQTVRELLLASTTHYVFANFEASTGKWQTSDGPATSWDRPDEPCPGFIEWLDPNTEHFDLRHVRLLRVFHCNSVFDPFSCNEPSGDGTIVKALLEAGAWRVEGGMTKETYLDFLSCLASMLAGGEALLLLLQLKALENGVDWERICADLERWVGVSVSSHLERE